MSYQRRRWETNLQNTTGHISQLFTRMHQVTDHEVKTAVELIQSGSGELYENLLTIGRGSEYSYRSVVERYLDYPQDPMVTRLAVQILCRYWGLTHEYVDRLEGFIKGVSWDDDGDIRTMAISCCDRLIAQPKYKNILKMIIDIFESSEETQVDRQAAYEALAIAFGVNINDIPSPARFRLDLDVNQEIISKAKQLVS